MFSRPTAEIRDDLKARRLMARMLKRAGLSFPVRLDRRQADAILEAFNRLPESATNRHGPDTATEGWLSAYLHLFSVLEMAVASGLPDGKADNGVNTVTD